jgi:hypothetical protein
MHQRSCLGILALSLLVACSEKASSEPRQADAVSDAPSDAGGVLEAADANGDSGREASEPAGCGATCPAVRNGVAECIANQCRARCPSGAKLCLGICVFDDDPCSEYLTCPTTNSVWCAGTCVKDESESCCKLQRCGAFACKDNRCLLSCGTDADCAHGHTCAQGQCGPCGHKGEPCCWDSISQRYDCSEPMVGCRLSTLKCEPLNPL